ncbi:MAG: S8 family peptidase [Peptostreptococcales bacterium]|jgi:serine protease AprX
MNMRKNQRKNIHPMVTARISAGTKTIVPVIIHYHRNIEDVKSFIHGKQGKISYELPFMNAVAAEIPADNVMPVALNKMIKFIDDDTKVFKTMDIASSFMGIRLANNYDYTGENIGIAIIDTGVAPHTDLVKPTNRIIGFKDFIGGKTSPYDDDGHGTHVAGIAAGNGFTTSKYAGIAPKANIIAIKVLDSAGSGNTSNILAGLQWVIDNKEKYNIRIVNMSLGTPADSSHREDPLAKGASAAVAAGLSVIVAGGNSGPNRKTINSPGISPDVITVGAIDDNRTTSFYDIFVADFSSRGPTPSGFSKPDIMAPGVDIMSLSNKQLNGYASHSGTSMATPIISGAAALLYQKNPYLTPRQIKKIIKGTALQIKGVSSLSQGSGVANIPKMLNID